MWWLAPAKLNLGLRVVGRRDDGYHLLESLFVPLDLADRVRVEVEAAAGDRDLDDRPRPRRRGPGRRRQPRGPRRSGLPRRRAGLGPRRARRSTSRFRSGAGLGGGSSDAAAVLRALARHFANKLSAPALAAIAVRLGADVPFFLDPRPAWVTGIGERIEALPAFPALDVLLVTPAPPLATAEVFRAYAAALTPPSPSRRMPALRDGPGWFPTATLLANDLEPIAARLRPAIERVRAEIGRLGAEAVAMSGSGPTVFGLFRDAEQARSASKEGRFEATDRVLVTRSHGAPMGEESWGVV